MSRPLVLALALWGSVGAAVPDQLPRIKPLALWEPNRVEFTGARWPVVYEVTAYCTCPECTGAWSGLNKTASGSPPVEGVTVAVDRRAWRFGSCIDLVGVGRRIAQDTGGAIKGNRLDLFMGDHGKALAWGRRSVIVMGCRNGRS